MRLRHRFALLILLPLTRLACAQESSAVHAQEIARPLEIRLTKPPVWKNYCLEVSITRVNLSKSPIFLPFNGVFIFSTVTDATNTLGQGEGEAWFPVHGLSDIISSDVTRLGPGEAKQDVYCLWDTFSVVNRETKMRRQVRLLGRLRISAGYFPGAQRWQISNAQCEEMMRTPAAKWKNADRSNGGSATIEVPIPCPEGVNEAQCATAPPVFKGERGVAIPDIRQ